MKHIIKEGDRNHVLSWDNSGTHCSEPECEVNKMKKHCSECKYHFKISVCHCGKCPTLEGYVCLFPHIAEGNYQCTYKENEGGGCELFTSRK